MPKQAEPQVVVHELDAETLDALERLNGNIGRLEEAIKLLGFIVAEAGEIWLPAGLLRVASPAAIARTAMPRTRKQASNAATGQGLFDGPEGQG